MPVLKNTRHERFAQELAAGKSQEAAYVAAGYAPAGANPNAARLIANDSVRARVAELQGRAARHVEWGIVEAFAELDEARRYAKLGVKPQAAAMVAATMGKAKLCGLIVDKQQHAGEGGGPIITEIVRRIVDPAD
ncbi:MAG: terminase small subunit [Bosea sp. (in: a-proteobacteria)]